MWAILKFDKKNLLNLKQDLKKKLGEDVSIYSPKLCIQNIRETKLLKRNLIYWEIICFVTTKSLKTH